MKLIKDSEARRLFVKFIEGEKGIISIPASDGGWPLMPFKEKACVWFEQTILYIFAQRQPASRSISISWSTFGSDLRSITPPRMY